MYIYGISVDKEFACNTEDLGSITGSGRSPGEGNNSSLQYSCLRKLMDRRACHCKESDTTEWLTFSLYFHGTDPGKQNNLLRWQNLHFKHLFSVTDKEYVGDSGLGVLSGEGQFRGEGENRYLVNRCLMTQVETMGQEGTLISRPCHVLPTTPSPYSLQISLESESVSCSVMSNSLWHHVL